MVKNFWDIETLGIRDSTTTTVAEQVHEQFLETIEFKDNRNHVANGKQSQLPSNIGIAFYRLKGMVQRLQKDSKLIHMYKTNFDEQLEQGIIKPVTTQAQSQIDSTNTRRWPISPGDTDHHVY
ncbi:hypothetical protein DdX_19843 [Ditylenchus destructor]|uniref:Uncharacterized protein n=1 Tax=Ditylenchus destructor TaxID=166010 RepID=A0AAD4MHA2_9BILA|nr:hypothetical protein DdX_19843 [Ditylenchus destructor]